MRTIGIIGANGQVGTEACLFLSLRKDIRVIPISRSKYGSSLLRHCGFEVRHGTVSDPAQVRRLTEGCDLVADFSTPQGTPPQIRRTMTSNITNTLYNSPDAPQYVYISSHSIWRHSNQQAYYRLYPRAKLFAENLSRKVGRETGKDVYVLRLGQVHGVLQGVSRDYRQSLRDEEAVLPDVPTLVVFVYSIAEALVNLLDRKEAPGTYTLVSVPQWSWPEVHQYYCGMAGVEPRYRVETPHIQTVGASLKAGILDTFAPLKRGLFSEREILDDYLSRSLPDAALKMRADYYVQRVQNELAQRDALAWRPTDQVFDAPGERMHSLSDSRFTMHDDTLAVMNILGRRFAERLGQQRQTVTT